MQNLNRRDLCLALPVLAALAALPAAAETIIQTNTQPAPPGETVLSNSHTYTLDQLTAKRSENGESLQVVRGILPTGEHVEVHETVLLAGHMPHPPHKHRHSEFMMIREGKLEFLNNGIPEPVGPGGIIFASSNVMHGLKNVGDTPAKYFVIAIGLESPARTA